MSAARLTTPNPTTARHGDQAALGAGATSGGPGSAGAGRVPPGCSDTDLLVAVAVGPPGVAARRRSPAVSPPGAFSGSSDPAPATRGWRRGTPPPPPRPAAPRP